MYQSTEIALRRGRLGISPMPGRTGKYQADLNAILHWDAGLVLTMTTANELLRSGAEALGPDLLAAGVDWHHLPIPDFIRVFELPEANASVSMYDLGKSARDVIDDNVPETGAVLFRNLNFRLTGAADFKEFWTEVMESEQKGDWKYYEYNSEFGYRNKISGVDTTARVDPVVMLRMHNEVMDCCSFRAWCLGLHR